MKILDYEIVEAKSAVVLRGIVREFIAGGWQPSGGVTATPPPSGSGYVLAQALVKYEEPVCPPTI
jgi:hypothetical protein